ncbi:hypothetical protein [Archangium violaceum]|uniref:PBS lyase n=1 Tax=Archangium violaceum Cb vi76 TaxID=1406225 RepID=A0A084T0Z0_9BACT|nr:hypothetical protein [Archangium violaceum]KFA94375.1 hypothetical protein Q664_03175 [Archangium violaceum Cb vi76]
MDKAQLQRAFVDAYHQGDEARAREWLRQLGARPRTVLEALFEEPDAIVRQAAAFGLGELGGAASVRRLEQQLALEEARGDHDAASVIEAITDALGRIAEASARVGLLRQVERLPGAKTAPADVNTLARALWRRRHPEILLAVQRALGRLTMPTAASLRGLAVLLEKSPEELGVWVEDPAVSIEQKAEVLTVLEEEVPDTLVPVLPAFIFTASVQAPLAVHERGEASYYCERLFILLFLHAERVIPALTAAARAELRGMARTLVAAKSQRCALRAVSMLQFVGQSEDLALLEAHRPEDATLAAVFDDVARAVRHRAAQIPPVGSAD